MGASCTCPSFNASGRVNSPRQANRSAGIWEKTHEGFVVTQRIRTKARSLSRRVDRLSTAPVAGQVLLKGTGEAGRWYLSSYLRRPCHHESGWRPGRSRYPSPATSRIRLTCRPAPYISSAMSLDVPRISVRHAHTSLMLMTTSASTRAALNPFQSGQFTNGTGSSTSRYRKTARSAPALGSRPGATLRGQVIQECLHG